MVRISGDQIMTKAVMRGINHSVTAGHHALNNANVNAIGPNPPITQSRRIVNSLDVVDEEDGHDPDHQFTQQQSAENKFLAENHTMSGFRTAKTYRGNSVYPWNPADFRPAMVGNVANGGAFQGGFVAEALQMNPGGYSGTLGTSLGNPMAGVNQTGIAVRGVNPFPITLPTRPRTMPSRSTAKGYSLTTPSSS
jgi:hypothetical protein